MVEKYKNNVKLKYETIKYIVKLKIKIKSEENIDIEICTIARAGTGKDIQSFL